MNASKLFMKELKKKGADDIVIKENNTHSYQIKFYNSKIDIVKEYDFKTMSVFVSKGKKTFLTTVKNLDPKNLRKKAADIMKFISMLTDTDYYGIADGPFRYRSNKGMFNKEIANLQKAIRLCESAISTAMDNGATRVSGVFEGFLDDEKLYSNHNVEAANKESHAYLSIRSLTDYHNKTSSGHTTSIARNFKDLNVNSKARESAELSVQGLETKKVPIGKYDIIYYPLASSSLIENIGDAASIFNVETQSSCFIKKVNKRVGNELVTISDDPTHNKLPGSEIYDEEGVPTEKDIIIDHGIFKKYLHNTSTAHKYKTKTTGNAGLPIPEASSTRLQGGDSNLAEMIKTTKKGLVVTNTWYTRFQNYSTGDFSTIPRDSILIVKNGSIVGSTYGIRLNDNLIRMMKNITLIGRKVYATSGWETERINQIPFFKVKNVLVTRPK